ncbi:MAG: protease [Bacteroidetes bacterium]|nr:MAG: protease [Bacteroidota bacterium]
MVYANYYPYYCNIVAIIFTMIISIYRRFFSAKHFIFLHVVQLLLQNQCESQAIEGYYKNPSVHKNTIVFEAGGDIWKGSIDGGFAYRLTTHNEEEKNPSISPDGRTITYSATYEGLPEVYIMPIVGGVSTRLTYSNSEGVRPKGWTPSGEIICISTELGSATNARLATLNVSTRRTSIIPLHQVHEAVQSTNGHWFFVSLPDMNSHVKRYSGGMARQIWTYDGKREAVKLTTKHLGESFNPMVSGDRIYFITDLDGTKNIWSMTTTGNNLKQETFHTVFDVRSASMNDGKIVYQYGADLWVLDITHGTNKKIEIKLASDFEQLRDVWMQKTNDYISSVNANSTGDKVVATVRGRVFVVPVKTGRTVEFNNSGKNIVRHRDAVFSSDGKSIFSLSDQSGEFGFVKFASDGFGRITPIANSRKPLSYRGIPSYDGKWLAFDDIDKNMFVLNITTGECKKISSNEQGIRDFSWSPDSQWLAFVQFGFSGFSQIKVYNVNTGSTFDLTNDRSNNLQVKWSQDGNFIYYLSDRNFGTLTGNPRSERLGGVGWNNTHKIYHVPLKKTSRSPFKVLEDFQQQLQNNEKPQEKFVITIDTLNIQSRTMVVPVAAGNYYQLEVNDNAIYVLTNDIGSDANPHLKAIEISPKKPELVTVVSGIAGVELTQNGKKLLIKKDQSYYMEEANVGTINLVNEIDFSGCQFSISPRDEWKQLYKDAWRMERDYFYDKNMHGVNWDSMYNKYLPFVERITTRVELNDVLAQLLGELSVLHTFVFGGDSPVDDKTVGVGNLGAKTSRSENNGGFRIDYIYKGDPDFPELRSPLDDPYFDIKEGDIITKVNGKDALLVTDIGQLLINQGGKNVLLSIKRNGVTKDFLVKISNDPYWLIYRDWQYNNRKKVERNSNYEIGYLHMSANEDRDIGQFYREYFPVANKKGLIIDMRTNEGGHISDILLQLLQRKVWMYRIDRTGRPIERVPHMVVLVNERTGSDGEVFAEGFKRLGLGTTIGMRTWGGFVALHFGNPLTDNGVASAPMHGGYSPEGTWLVEGVGHVPDIEVDNLPNETFHGKDAQLEAAINFLKKKIIDEPREIPLAPQYPDKSFKNNSARSTR